MAMEARPVRRRRTCRGQPEFALDALAEGAMVRGGDDALQHTVLTVQPNPLAGGAASVPLVLVRLLLIPLPGLCGVLCRHVGFTVIEIEERRDARGRGSAVSEGDGPDRRNGAAVATAARERSDGDRTGGGS